MSVRFASQRLSFHTWHCEDEVYMTMFLRTEHIKP